MIFWILFLCMIVAAVLFVLLPLMGGEKQQATSSDTLSVYRQQLADIEERIATSNGDPALLEQERVEIGHRILNVSRKYKSEEPDQNTGFKRTNRNKVATSLIALIFIPLISLGFYINLGSVGMSDVPLSLAQDKRLEDKSIEEMVLIAERYLAKNPQDEKGWTLLADVYGRMNRPDDKARALREIIRISGPSSKLLTDLAEALTVARGNIVPIEARKMFEQALSEDQNNHKAAFYLALGLEQEGNMEAALKRWQDLSAMRKDDPQWQTVVTGRMKALQAQIEGTALGNPSAEDVENAASLSSTERNEMIASMVSQLAEKLQENPDNFEGWMRLIRSYSVLKQPQQALETLQRAKIQFKENPEQLAQLDKVATQLGLDKLQLGESK